MLCLWYSSIHITYVSTDIHAVLFVLFSCCPSNISPSVVVRCFSILLLLQLFLYCLLYFIINNSSLQCISTFTCVLVFYTTNEKQQQQIKIDIIKTNKRSNRNYIYLAVLLYFVWFAFILFPLRQTNLNFKYIKMLLINQVVANSVRCMPL